MNVNGVQYYDGLIIYSWPWDTETTQALPLSYQSGGSVFPGQAYTLCKVGT